MPRWGNLPTGPILAVDRIDLDQAFRDAFLLRDPATGNVVLSGNADLEIGAAGYIWVGSTTYPDGPGLGIGSDTWKFYNGFFAGRLQADRILVAGMVASELEKKPLNLPIWNSDLTRFAGNPVITNATIGGFCQFVADPNIIEVDGTLYMFFEAYMNPPSLGEIWWAKSTDGTTWTNFAKLSTAAYHFSHPQALVHNGRIYVFYAAARNAGEIYYRSAAIPTDPWVAWGAWSAETIIIGPNYYGPSWPFINFAIVPHKGAWYLLLENNTTEDRLRGLWSPHFTLDWNTEGNEIRPTGQWAALFDLANFPWANRAGETSPLVVGEQLLLYFGTERASDGVIGMATWVVTELSPWKFSGHWVVNDLTFEPTADAWQSFGIHKSSAAIYKGKWIYAYDGTGNIGHTDWAIGIATMPVTGVSTAAAPTGVGSKSIMGAVYGTELRITGYGTIISPDAGLGGHSIGGSAANGRLLAIGNGAIWSGVPGGSTILAQIMGTMLIQTNQNAAGFLVSPTGVTAQGTNLLVASAQFVEPNITLAGATVTRAATLYIENEPTEGSTANAALMFGSAAKIHGLSSLSFKTEAGSIGLNPADRILLPRETVMDPLDASVLIGGTSNQDIVLNRAISTSTWDIWEIIATENNNLRFWATVVAFRGGIANVFGTVIEHLDAQGATVTLVDNANGTYTINYATGAQGQRVAWRLTRRSTYTA